MTAQPTVLHVITGLNLGGAEMMLSRLVTQSSNFRHEVVSLSPLGLVSEALKAADVSVSSLNMQRGQLDPRAIYSLRRQIVSAPAAVIQTWMCHADLIGTLAAHGTKVPVIWNIRNTYDQRTSWAVPVICARLSTRPALVLANSHTGKASYEALGYRPRAWRVIPNGFDVHRFAPDPNAPFRIKPRLRISPANLVVGLVARRHPLKNHEGFLRAASLVKDQFSGVKFVLIGGGLTSDDELTSLIASLGLSDLVLRPGVHRAVEEILPALDILVSSSRSEGFPNVVGEAMSCGVPCVVTDVGDSARLVGETGIVVPPSEPEALADGILQLLRMPAERRREIGRRARSRIETTYSLDRAVAEYEDVYSALMPK